MLQVGDGDAAPAGGGRALCSPLPLPRSGESVNVNSFHLKTSLLSSHLFWLDNFLIVNVSDKSK